MDLDQINESITELQNAFQRLRLERTFESSDGVTPFTPRTFVEERITKIVSKKEKDDDDEEEEKGKKVTTKLPSIKSPEFSGEDFESFLEDFERWMRLTGLENEKEVTKLDWLVECTTGKAKVLVKKLARESQHLGEVLRKMSKLFPKLENDLTLRAKMDKLPQLPYNVEPSEVAKRFLDLEDLMSKMSESAMSDQEKFIMLTKKIHPKTFSELRGDRLFKRRTEKFLDLKEVLLEKSEEDWQERHLAQLKKETLNTINDEATKVSMQQSSGKGRGDPNRSNFQQQSQSSNGRGKGKGKGIAKGKGSAKPPAQDPKFHASITCKFCGKRGHYVDRCWEKFPNLKPSKFSKPSAPQQPRPTPMETEKTPEEASKKRKAEVLTSLQGKSLVLQAHVNGSPLEAIIDTGATISVVSKNFVASANIARAQTIPVEVGNGETVFTCGTTTMVLKMGEKEISHQAHVLETNAFQAVLGMDFLAGPRCQGILTFPSPSRLLVDGEIFPLQERRGQTKSFTIFRLFKKESYTLVDQWKEKALQDLEISRGSLTIDLFANHINHQETKYCTRKNSAYMYNWEKLGNDSLMWANPPFSQLSKVLTKAAMEPCKIVMCTPNWPGDYWMRILEKISSSQVKIPVGVGLYKGDWDKKPLPPPKWETLISLVDTTRFHLEKGELDPKIVMAVKKMSKGWDQFDLEREMKNYPIFPPHDMMEREREEAKVIQPDLPDLSPIKPVKEEMMNLATQTEEENQHHSTFLQGNEEKALGEVQKFLGEKIADMEMLTELMDEVDLEFHKNGHIPKELTQISLGDVDWVETTKARPSSEFLVNHKDLEEFSMQVRQRILSLEKQLVSKKEEFFETNATENLQGEFEKDLKKFPQPKLQALLKNYQEVFGPLPPPGSGCKLVEMDIELKEEFKGKTLRQKCWPMPQEDSQEIEKQVQELIEAKLVEPFPVGTFPQHCSPTFLVDKKESKTRRMVGQYVKLNSMTKPHAGFLPNMEEMIENMAKCKFKSKLDLRS